MELQATPDVSDEQLVAAALRRDASAFERLLRRYNQRLFRVARAQLGSDEEAEEVTQQAWVQVYAALAQWTGRGSFSGWAASIVINACRQWRREMANEVSSDALDAMEDLSEPPDETTHRVQVRAVLERHVEALPPSLRTVFVMRDVEEMSGLEVAEALQIGEPLVRVRLHRARRAIEASLQAEFQGEGRALYSFLGSRCDRLTHAVLNAVGLL
jgi:RNA polymerase sigma-70 factor (ECF subfamily)